MIFGMLPVSASTISRANGQWVSYVTLKLGPDPTLPLNFRRSLILPNRVSVIKAAAALECAENSAPMYGKFAGELLQQIMLSRALPMESDLLILDEAIKGLNQAAPQIFINDLNKLTLLLRARCW